MKYLRILFMLLVAAVMGACDGDNHYQSIDDLISQGGGSVSKPEPLPEVPDGVLHLFADRTEIPANGSTTVNFTVMWGKEDVSENQSMHIIRTEEDGEEVKMEAGSHAFSTTAPGKYKFKAQYFIKGNKYSENEVEVTATEVSGSQDFDRLVLGFQFTSLGCTFCPAFSETLHEVIDEQKGRFEVLCFHQHFNGNDPLTIPMGELFYRKLTDGQGLPKFSLNMHGEIPTIKNNVVNAIDNELKKRPATCGVAIESAFDETTRKATVTLSVNSNVEAEYRWMVILTENDVTCDQGQMGVTYPTLYKHRHLVRLVNSDNIYGNKFTGKLTPGNPESKTYISQELPKEWNAENMRAVAIALSSEDGGKTYYVNNAAACPLVGGSVKPDPDPEPTPDPTPGENQFVRHIAYFKITGSWCAPCFKGSQTLGLALQDYREGDYKDKIHRLEFHGEDANHDPMFSEATNSIGQLFKSKFSWDGTYPFGVTDMHTGKNPSEQTENDLFNGFDKSLNDYPAHCGVAVKSTLNGTKADVTVRLMSEKSEVYRMAVYVLESGIVYEQNTGMQTNPNYVHNHVVRQLISQGVQGDKLVTGTGIVEAGTEASKTYSVTLNSNWDKNKLSICAIAFDANGMVNNVAVCDLNGGNTDYDRKK